MILIPFPPDPPDPLHRCGVAGGRIQEKCAKRKCRSLTPLTIYLPGKSGVEQAQGKRTGRVGMG